jgi:DNA primase
MPASNGFIDFRAIKAAVTMEQVLDHYGLKDKLRPIGDDSLTGCCPIHEGHNPTQFRVSLGKNCWKCFSDCQCGGNVLDFIAKMEEVPIYDAAKLAVEWFKLPMEDAPRRGSPAGPSGQRDAITKASGSSPPAKAPPKQAEPELESDEPNPPLKFALKNLNPEHPYFAERGLTPESVSLFGLGHCTKGILNGRIAIPIHNGNGELVAYAGRWPGQPPDERPKYQLPKGFRKSMEVFNLHRAKAADATSPLIIVEGFFDCMAVWQAGLQRVVALMGSALAPAQEEQIAQLVGHRGQIALMFDPDEAGLSARENALRRFASRAYVRVIELRDLCRQPDELAADEIQELLLRDDIGSYEPAPALFPLGMMLATPNALRSLTELDIRTALARHMRGDWGELDAEDKEANNRALTEGTRLFSAYKAASGTRFWIITEADRSATTVLLPEDY